VLSAFRMVLITVLRKNEKPLHCWCLLTLFSNRSNFQNLTIIEISQPASLTTKSIKGHLLILLIKSFTSATPLYKNVFPSADCFSILFCLIHLLYLIYFLYATLLFHLINGWYSILRDKSEPLILRVREFSS